MGENRLEKFLKDVMGSDEEFYERFLSELSEEQLQRFLDENPDFLQD